MNNNIVIIGAGYAGVLTAKKLEKKFRKRENISITIIDRNPFHAMLTELHEVAASRVDEGSIKMSLKKIFAGRRVNVVQDTIGSIDFKNKHITGKNAEYEYDYLVLAAGSKPTHFNIPGAEEYSHKLWSYDDAVMLRDHIHNMFRDAVKETDPDEKRKMLSFFIVGAGFTGVEIAGELAEYVPILCEKYEIDREFVTIVNVDSLSRTVPTLPEKLSRKVEKRLDKMGVKLMLNSKVCGVDPNYIEIEREDKFVRYNTKSVIWAAGIESADITGKAAKYLESAKRGRIAVDSYLRSKDDEHVYVIGDNMYYVPEGETAPVPQMVENTEQSSAIAAKNIYCEITGEGEMSEYKPSFHGMMVSIGGRYGVARVGLPNRMINLPSFFAMFTKHFINIVYFIQVLGWNKVISYLKHEFFTIRNKRSFVGGHFSNRTPSFLLVPLRLWLGAVWLFEGIMKIVDGWFQSPKLTGFFGGANSWYNNILSSTAGGVEGKAIEAVATATTAVATATTTVAEATSGATAVAPEVTQAVGTALINFNFLNIIRFIFVSGNDLAHSTLSDYAVKLDIPLMNWFIDTLILPNDSVQMFMQIFIVVAEILIGLALIGGLFTTPASAFSLVLQFMFITTTGLYLGTVWMVFAAIALLIGAGSIFGIDYYFMPYLKEKWKRLPFVRKLYIYND